VEFAPALIFPNVVALPFEPRNGQHDAVTSITHFVATPVLAPKWAGFFLVGK